MPQPEDGRRSALLTINDRIKIFLPMKVFTFSIQLVLCLFANVICGQNSISGTYGASIPSNRNQFDEQCAGVLSIPLPTGNVYNVIGIQIEYDIASINGAFISHQFSKVRLLNNLVSESDIYGPSSDIGGVQSYLRNATIANGTYAGGTILNFELQVGRNYGGSGCDENYVKVSEESWIITIYYSNTLAVGIDKTSSLIAKLDVNGVAGAGSTNAAFGTDGAGVSFQQNPPTIGFNQYQDGSNSNSFGKYMANGYAASVSLDNDGKNSFNIFPIGVKDNVIPSAIKGFRFMAPYFTIQSNIQNINSSLEVGRANNNGTSIFKGTNFHSVFNFGEDENTYISGGKSGSKVYFNDYSTNVDQGEIILYGKNSVGIGASTDPGLALQVHGGFAFSKHISINSKGGAGNPVDVLDCSFIDITGVDNSNQPTNGLYIILHSNRSIRVITAINDFTLEYYPGCMPAGPSCPPYTLSMTAGDTVILQSRDVLSFSNN